MSFAAIEDTIRGRFKTLVADAQSVTVAYPNAPFETPGTATTWVRMSILYGESRQIELEANDTSTYEGVGELRAQIFTAAEQSTGVALDLADAIVAAFRRVRIGFLIFRVPRVEQVGESGGRWQTNVICPWEYLKTAS